VASFPRLANRRILITRTPERSSELAATLQAEGATVLSIPAIEIIPPESYGPLDEALACLDKFDWIVFTSAHSVEVFAERRDPSVSPRHIAAIGPATAKAIERLGLPVTLVPSVQVAESLADSLVPHAEGTNFLLIRAAEARQVLPAALIQAGARLTVVEAYRNRIPLESAPRLRELFASPTHYPDAISFTSASTARNLIALLEVSGLTLPTGIVLASIGPITSQALRDLGLEPTVEAGKATIAELAQALIKQFA
jgi:uroporphyrinogen-III synthase